MPIRLKEFGQLGGYIILAEPFDFDDEVIALTKVVFGDNAGTRFSAVAL